MQNSAGHRRELGFYPRTDGSFEGFVLFSQPEHGLGFPPPSTVRAHLYSSFCLSTGVDLPGSGLLAPGPAGTVAGGCPCHTQL